MTCGIYCITNNINGKQYVGQSIHIEKRFKEHCQKCRGLTIDKAIQKYGEDNFEFKILEVCSMDSDVLNEKEVWWIEKLGTYASNNYNLTRGGNNGEHQIGFARTESTRSKISHKLKGKNNGMAICTPTISKNGFNNGKQQYKLQYMGKRIATSCSIEKLEYIRDFEDWDNLNTPKVSLIKDGSSGRKQKWSIMYKKVCLKTTYNLDKAKKIFKLAKFKLEGENKEYYENNLHEVIPCRKYVSKNPNDLNNVGYSECKCRQPTNKEKIKMSSKLTKSGVYRVACEKDRFRYIYKDILGKKRSLCSIDGQKLKMKVIDMGLEWIVLDEDKARANGLV